jgi:hypothetical protein
MDRLNNLDMSSKKLEIWDEPLLMFIGQNGEPYNPKRELD